jgi:glycosyltransferase involved in cell wall biosynthesis
MTHPVQYLSPWFRYITLNCPEINLTVLYGIQPTPNQQGVGFGRAFEWDVPLVEGYCCRFIRPAREDDNVHSEHFWGLNLPEIKAAIYETEPDVVLISGWHSIIQIRAIWACLLKRIPILYRGDTHLGNSPSGWRKVIWVIKTRFLLWFFTGYLSVGKRTHRYLQGMGVPSERIFKSPHCVDSDYFAAGAALYQNPSSIEKVRTLFGLPPDDFVILFVGKLEPKKRPIDLIRAVSRLGIGTSLLIVGTGTQERACREEVQKLGVRAVLVGFLNQSEIARAYAAADCLALPSDWGETWGLVVNEAMATGLPCVISDRVGCAPDMISPGETGEVFKMGDTSDLAEALERIRERKRKGQDWSSACKVRVASYSFAAATKGLLDACKIC